MKVGRYIWFIYLVDIYIACVNDISFLNVTIAVYSIRQYAARISAVGLLLSN